MGSSSVVALPSQRVIVGVGEVRVSNVPATVLSTYGLGSCLAVAAYDPGTNAGGLVHLMLPVSTVSPEKALFQPAMFADTGLPHLFHALVGLNCDVTRLRVFLAGGASLLCANDAYKIGERNIAAATAYLSQHHHVVHHSAIGGTVNRTVHFHVGTGEITLKTPTSGEYFQLGG